MGVVFATAQTSNPSPYCASSYTSTSLYPEISRVELLTLANTTTHTPSPGYTFYNNLGPTNLIYGNPAVLKVTFKNVDMETMLKAWIDYDQDNVFETSELVLSIPQGSVGNGMAVVKQSTINVPITSAAGLTRMRVSLGWHYANWGNSTFRLDSCHTALTGDGSAGETEDYPLLISFPLNVREVGDINRIDIYPNPVTDVLNAKGLDLNSIICIYDLRSVCVSEFVVETGEEKWNVEKLKPGIYFIETKNKKGEVNRSKFFKE